MNTLTTTQNNAIDIFNDNIFASIERVSSKLANSKLVPNHLQGKPDDCFLVVQQAYRWGIDPFAVAQGTSVVQGKLCYEGKLVAAVLQNLTGIELDYKYSGDGEDRTVIVAGKRRADDVAKEITIMVKNVKTVNTKWKEMPDQMLAYRGAREWTRRWSPGVILGVYTEDEMDGVPMKNIGGGSTLDISSDPVLAEMKAEQNAKPKNKRKKAADVDETNVVDIAKDDPNQEDTTEIMTPAKYGKSPAELAASANDSTISGGLDLSKWRLSIRGKKGDKVFLTLNAAAEHLMLFMNQFKYRVDRKALLDENIALTKALDAVGDMATSTEIYKLMNQGEIPEEKGQG